MSIYTFQMLDDNGNPTGGTIVTSDETEANEMAEYYRANRRNFTLTTALAPADVLGAEFLTVYSENGEGSFGIIHAATCPHATPDGTQRIWATTPAAAVRGSIAQCCKDNEGHMLDLARRAGEV
ncbi:hypothetical protein [Nocardia sp. NPDC005745]|uniref:hypothetical protein n=1 Tax=Nocardia sp. NPDC005745 TaxID=3157061 RepID=UPI0034099ABE